MKTILGYVFYNPDEDGAKNIFHKDQTQSVSLLFFFAVRCPNGRMEKVLPRKAQNLQLRN